MLTRRDFLARLQAAGIALPFAGQSKLFSDQSLNSVSEIFQNDFFSVSFGTKNGFLEITQKQWRKAAFGVRNQNYDS